jgi:hypothetical protein
LLDAIADELVRALQAGLPDIPEARIRTDKPNLKKTSDLPAISVSSAEFTFQDAGVGGGGTDVKDVVKVYFSGDGKTVTFTLSDKPIRPMLGVESPKGHAKVENNDYTVDYVKSEITFSSPPPRGKNNVLARFYSASTSGEAKYVQMNITYNVDVWATEEKERDSLTIEVIKAIVLSEEGLSTKGMRVTPSRGLNLDAEDIGADGVVAKRLIYSVEANLQVKTLVPTMERIEIEQKPPK